MKAFTALYTALDETNKTNEKVEALTRGQLPPGRKNNRLLLRLVHSTQRH